MLQTAAATTNTTTHVNLGEAREVLTFTLGKEEYGIDILKVQEIRGYDIVTTIPNSPAYLKGVINLRGVIVPIVDLRIQFNLGEVKYDQFTVVIILNIGKRVVGVVVDSVSDVTTLAAEQIQPAPQLGNGVNAEYLSGMGTIDERMLILLDIEKLMSENDLTLSEGSLQ